MLQQLTVEKKFMFVIALALLLLIMQSLLSYHTISGLAAHTQHNYQTGEAFLEKLQEEAKAPASQQIDLFRKETRNMHERTVQQAKSAQITIVIFPQIGIIVLILIGVLFARQLRAMSEKEES